MTGTKKTVLIILGTLTGILIISQLALGQIILSGPANVQKIVKAHQHTGYLTVTVSLIYVIISLLSIIGVPVRTRE